MANLLDQASIVLTPTAYDNGKVLCAKPSEPPYGDFDFSRNSAATRVNAQGLVENVQILSSNLVQNGDFSEEGVQEVSNGSFSQEGVEQADDSVISNAGGSVMTKLSALNYNATSDGTGGSTVRPRLQFNNTTIGKSYRIRITPTNQSGTIDFKLYDGSQYIVIGNDLTTDIDLYFKAEGANILIAFDGTEVFNVDFEISLKEVGQDWTFTNWSLTTDNALLADTSGYVHQSNVFEVGKSYKVSVNVKDYTSGDLRIDSNGQNFWTPSGSNSVATIYISNLDRTYLLLEGTFRGSITNISVKEVGQNWALNGVDFSLGSVFFNSDTDNIFQNGGYFSSGTKYKLTFEGSGNLAYRTGFAGADGTRKQITLPHTAYLTATADTNRIQAYGANGNLEGTLTNITIIEITDDTNLPRINYEGFSYQDALGSELVTNGDFSDGSSGWTTEANWTISDGLLNGYGTVTETFRLDTSIVSGKSYLFEFEITSYTSGTVSPKMGGASGTFVNAIGIYKQIVVAGSGGRVVSLDGNGFTGSIDNVSVKEYLGQEVVPDSGCGSWLFEPQTTQKVIYSEDFSQWIAAGDTTIEGGYLAPDGTNNAYKVSGTNSILALTGVINTTSTRSIYARTVSGTGLANLCSINSNTNNLFTITEQWQRFEVNSAVPTGASNFYAVDFRGGTTLTEIILWGANATNDQDYATSYIPTSGSTVTRNQDLCTNGGSLASINSTEGVLYAEIAALANDLSNRQISLNNGTTDDRIQLYFNTSSNRVSVFYKSQSGATQFILNHTLSDIKQFNKLAFKWKQNDFALWSNGLEVATQTSGVTSIANTLTNLDFQQFNSAADFFGKTKAVAVWKEALSDQELADLTYPTPTDPTFALHFDTIATDFTFARGSEATYVDAQGLIQSTNELGAEEITNGDFATDSDWTKTNAVIENGKAILDIVSGGGASVLQSSVMQQNKTYKITFDAILLSGNGSLTLSRGGQNNVTNALSISQSGTFSQVLKWVSADNVIGIKRSGGGDFSWSIDNVSVKEHITATNTPRLDYSTGAEAFLLEPQSTNLIPYSEDFSVSNWAKGNSSIISNIASSPSGIVNASKLVENTNLSSHTTFFNSPNTPVTSGQKYTMSFFAKEDGRNIRISNAAESSMNVAYNLLTGTVILSGGAEDSSSIVNYGNGWYRCIMSFTALATIVQFNLALIDENNAVTYQGDGTSGVNIWGAQIEQQSYATSYIPTSGTSVTRNQETCNNATPEINSEEGVLYAEISALADDGAANRISLSDGTNNNRVLIGYNAANTIQFVIQSLGAISVNQTFTLTDITQFSKIAFKYKENDCSFWIDGVKVGTDTIAAMPIGLNQALFAQGFTNEPFFGNTKDLQVYTKALSDAELMKLTT